MDTKQDETKIMNNYDWLRVLSAFMVIVIHVNAKFLIRNDVAMIHSGMTYYLELLINIVTRFSVPCFVMLSGAFLLNKEQNADFGYFYKKSFFKIVVPFLVMAGIWMVYLFFSLEQDFGRTILTVNFGGYWYMPMLIILYLLTPLIIRLKKSTTEKQFAVISIVFMVWAVISQMVSTYKVPYASGVVVSYMGYFMMGNVLHNLHVENRRKHIGLSLVGCVLMVVVTMYVRLKGYAFYQYDAYRAFFSPTIVIYSLLVFWLFHNLDMKHSIRKLSEASYYIYLLHMFVLVILLRCFGLDLCGKELCSLIIWIIVVFAVSALLAILVQFLQRQMKGRRRI